MRATYVYAGHVSETCNGIVCQAWSEQYPHRHQERSVNKRFRTDENVTAASNYCRDAAGTADYTWCYTFDPDITRAILLCRHVWYEQIRVTGCWEVIG
jgi:hypothetical protein